jgi:hypothetical protein
VENGKKKGGTRFGGGGDCFLLTHRSTNNSEMVKKGAEPQSGTTKLPLKDKMRKLEFSIKFW